MEWHVTERNMKLIAVSASIPKVFFSTAPLNSNIPSKSTAQARSPPSSLKIHHHDEVHRACEDHRACEVPRPCDVPRPCEVHRVGGLLRKSTTPKHRKVFFHLVQGKREVKSSPHSWNKGKKTKMEKDAQVRILYRCDTKYIVEVNNVVKATHRLSMVGKSVPFDSEVSGLVGSLFENKPISVRDISNKIKNYVSSDDDDDVQSVCRTSRIVNNMPFKILDNLNNLSDFNWADSVHTFLIGGMNRGHKVLLENQNSSSLNIAGYVAVIQIWATRRLRLEDVQTENQFPRILHWPLVKIRTVNIESLFEKTKMQNVENLFWLLMNDKNQMKPTFELVIDDLPHQPNLHDCGILVLKYLQMWDGLKRFDGKNMPSYSCVSTKT
ncbi:hypothetical protein DEO72_LG10g2803 [Vigna unguiculata]|uniref:Ulp1 protease family n=1 Tax=Vigna unguiculata TaxID=3917 RepID=A0A4D6NCH6_VIGUN|nr:hypothetical protein DEO72_LG10g2803 [Vigna unguiculata]